MNPATRLSISVPRSRVSGIERPERVEIFTPPVIRPRSPIGALKNTRRRNSTLVERGEVSVATLMLIGCG